MSRWSPSRRSMVGVVCCRPLFAPVVVEPEQGSAFPHATDLACVGAELVDRLSIPVVSIGHTSSPMVVASSGGTSCVCQMCPVSSPGLSSCRCVVLALARDPEACCSLLPPIPPWLTSYRDPGGSRESSCSALLCLKDGTWQHFIGDTLMMIAHNYRRDRNLCACHELRCSHRDDGPGALLSLSLVDDLLTDTMLCIGSRRAIVSF